MIELIRVGNADPVATGVVVTFDLRFAATADPVVGAAVIDLTLTHPTWSDVDIVIDSAVAGQTHALGPDTSRIAVVAVDGIGAIARVSAKTTAAGAATRRVASVHATVLDAVAIDGRPLSIAPATAHAQTSPPALQISSTALPQAHRDLAYHAALRCSEWDVTWQRVSGELPAGLTLDATGIISGTPTVEEVSTFDVRATAADELRHVEATITVTVAEAPLRLTLTSLPPFVAGAPYRATLTATGGKRPLNWTVHDLPPGLSVDDDEIIGTPRFRSDADDPWTVRVEVGDASVPSHDAQREVRVPLRAATLVDRVTVGAVSSVAAGRDLVIGQFKITVTGELTRDVRVGSDQGRLDEYKEALFSDIANGVYGEPYGPGFPGGPGIGSPTGGPDDGPQTNRMPAELAAALALYRELDELSSGTVIMRSTARIAIDDDEVLEHRIGDLADIRRSLGTPGDKRSIATSKAMHALWAKMLARSGDRKPRDLKKLRKSTPAFEQAIRETLGGQRATSPSASTAIPHRLITAITTAVRTSFDDDATSSRNTSRQLTAADIFDLVATPRDGRIDDAPRSAAATLQLTPGAHTLEVTWSGESFSVGNAVSASSGIASVLWTVTIEGDDHRQWARFSGTTSTSAFGSFIGGTHRQRIELPNSAIDVLLGRPDGTVDVAVDTMDSGLAVQTFPIESTSSVTALEVFAEDPHGRSSCAASAGNEVVCALNDGIDGWRSARTAITQPAGPLAATRFDDWPVVIVGGRMHVHEVQLPPGAFAGDQALTASPAALSSAVVDDIVSALTPVIIEESVDASDDASMSIERAARRRNVVTATSIFEARGADRAPERTRDRWFDHASLLDRLHAAEREAPAADPDVDADVDEPTRRRRRHLVVGSTLLGPTRFILDPATGLVAQLIADAADPSRQPTAMWWDEAENRVVVLQSRQQRLAHITLPDLLTATTRPLRNLERPNRLVAGVNGYDGVAVCSTTGRTVTMVMPRVMPNSPPRERLLHESSVRGLDIASSNGTVAVVDGTGALSVYR